MAHMWHRGVLEASSWHGLEEVGVMADAEAQIGAGERTGAWPVALRMEPVLTAGGLKVPAKGIVASYLNHPEACLSAVGDRYRATTPEEWRTLVKAAVAAGARPTGAFALYDGTRALATFEVGKANGLRTQLLLVDSFDGSMGLTCGTTSIRVVCANTLSMSLSRDGGGMANLRHTKSLEQRVNVLAESIGEAIVHGEKVRATYEEAEQTRLSRKDADRIFDLLFPKASDDAEQAKKTRAENVRRDALTAMALPVNQAGDTLATLWNAATYLVDRNADESAREVRGDGDRLESMLFGSRGKRVEEIQTIIEVVMRDGSIQPMTVTQAQEVGIDPHVTGKAVLDEILAALP